MKNDWKRKLTSRKFWAAVVGFVTQIMVASGASEGTVTQTTAVIMASATLIAYMLAEGIADNGKSGNDTSEPEEEQHTSAIGFEVGYEEDETEE